MKLITTIFALLLSAQAMAHEDHALGDSHLAYHMALYALLTLVIFKGYGWLKAKKRSKNKE
ncbi:hypothetical protein [Paraglaciecola sp. L3A3]|uniref:hypothetical protein n=1 Tax=Paraglaciecola sp. L3A3 TaxID=2686358 RepID=UPI00131C79DB|nr:hypothetical protein [Paraglaciecola sp. L3A3]